VFHNRKQNELLQFIYHNCFVPISDAVKDYVGHLPNLGINLQKSSVKYPDSASLDDMEIMLAKNITIDEDTLNFDAVLRCDITVSEKGIVNYSEDLSDEICQWYTASCTVTINGSLISFHATNITIYEPGCESLQQEGAASANCVPLIGKEDLDKEAERFLKKFYPDALEKPLPVPIEQIVKEQMKLDVIRDARITNDSSVLGEISFVGGKLNLLDESGKPYQLDVRPGTIIVDSKVSCERKAGCTNNTIAHEAFHWYKHRLCAAVKRIVSGVSVVAHRCPVDITYPGINQEWTDKQRMEWQANKIAPKILMPRKQFIQKTEELLNKFDFYNCYDKKNTLEDIIAELASFYQVSKQSAGIRLGETGSSEVKSILAPPVVKMPEEALFYEYCVNADFRALIDSGCFRYINGYLALDDKKYVQPGRSGVDELTQYAKEHLAECVIHFLPRNVNINRADGRYINLQFFGRSKEAYVSLPYYDQSQNGPVLESLTQVEKDQAGFDRFNQFSEVIKRHTTFWGAVGELMQLAGWDKYMMERMTCIDAAMYYRAKDSNDSPADTRTIVAFAYGLDLTSEQTRDLLQKAGHAFSNSREDRAYQYCISTHSNRSIEQANEFLKSIEVPPLGSNQRI